MKDGQLTPASTSDAARLKLFNKSVQEGETIEVYLTRITNNDKTLGQLAKVHTLIRELAAHTGHTFDEMKNQVKFKAGLFSYIDKENVSLKSFSDCSKDELATAIDTCFEIGHLIGFYMD